MDDLTAWLRDQLDDDEVNTRTLLHWAQQTILMLKEPRLCGKEIPGWHDWPVVEMLCQQHLAELEVMRRLSAEHQPEWRTVEWPHDQNGKGEAQVCRRCQNAEHSTWNPPVGQAGILPEGFIVPYVLAPCTTLRLLVLPYADRPGYRAEWAPEGQP
ncbi:DUF6221 family protein [Micromonospora chalcea]|uniref:DUF6221 family protein n=1 Tax=Micromonospora chalcea TaxID=1874 RepID=UPI0037FD0CCE